MPIVHPYQTLKGIIGKHPRLGRPNLGSLTSTLGAGGGAQRPSRPFLTLKVPANPPPFALGASYRAPPSIVNESLINGNNVAKPAPDQSQVGGENVGGG